MEDLANFDQIPVKVAVFDPFAAFDDVESGFSSRLPLNNLHWNVPGRQLRHIPTLPVELIKESQEESIKQHQMLGLSDSPYLKLMLVKCDTDTYKSSVRKMIREWIKSVINLRTPTEWLIVYYSPTSSKKKSVYDKIRADFNSGQNRDRCVLISPEGNDLEIWSDVLTKMKDGILAGFSERVKAYQQELEKFSEKREVAGWNVGMFFVMKESLALSFENMGLFSDALQIYDELDTDMSANNSGHFSLMGFDECKPTPSLSLDITKNTKDYRHEIAASNISLFEFYSYLMHRQSVLLLREARVSTSESISSLKISELYNRLRAFTLAMANKLESGTSNVFAVVEWSFALISEYLEVTGSLQGPEVSQGRGDMILLCRKDLETLASAKGWNKSIFTDVDLGSPSEKVPSDYKPSNTILAEALSSEKSFFEMYTKLTKAAIEQFTLAKGRHVLMQLNVDLANIDFQAGNYESALQRIQNLPQEFYEEGWALLSTAVRSMYVECLEKSKGSPLEILSNKLDLAKLSQSQHGQGANPKLAEEISDLIGELHASETKLTKSLKEFVDYTISPYVVQSEQGDYIVTITCRSLVRLQMSIERASLRVASGNRKLEFNCTMVDVGDDFTDICLTTQSFSAGTFNVISLKMDCGCLILDDSNGSEYVYLVEQPFGVYSSLELGDCQAVNKRTIRSTVHVPESVTLKSMDINMIAPNVVVLEPRSVTGPPIYNVKQLKTGLQTSFDFATSKETHKETILELPLQVEFEVNEVSIEIEVDFVSGGEQYKYHIRRQLNVRLAIDVGMESFFKSDRIISKFSVGSNNDNEPLRIQAVNLKSNNTFETKAVYAGTGMVAIREKPLSYVFSLDHSSAEASDEPLVLELQYRYLSDECRASLLEEMTTYMKKGSFGKYTLLVKQLLDRLIFDTSIYLTSQIIDTHDECLDGIQDDTSLSLIPVQDKVGLIRLLRQCLKTRVEHRTFDELDKSLSLSLSVPKADIVHVVSMHIPTQEYFELGEAIEGSLQIKSIRKWCHRTAETNSKFMYSLSVPPDTWAISGKRQGTFHGGDETIKLSLVPLRRGRLSYPKIEITSPNYDDLQMKVDYRNDFDTILIMPTTDRQTTHFQ